LFRLRLVIQNGRHPREPTLYNSPFTYTQILPDLLHESTAIHSIVTSSYLPVVLFSATIKVTSTSITVREATSKFNVFLSGQRQCELRHGCFDFCL